MPREVIYTENAPQAIGAYSQAVRCGGTVYISGQIPIDPQTQELVSGDFAAEVRQVFANLQAVAEAAGGRLSDAVKIGIYLTDMNDFAAVNIAMQAAFPEPFPARAAVGVAALPKGARVEADAILVLA